MSALQIYRAEFRPSESLEHPYVMPCISVFAAETDAEAQRLFTSLQQQFVNLRRGRPGPLPEPIDNTEGRWSAAEQATLTHTLSYAVVGSPLTVKQGLETFLAQTGADELMITAQIFNHTARLRSFEIVAEVRDALVMS
jgi:alkanesulfonate monooxygenase SsuD/methylene tetrahydromethanopterin reductase-like flavin-dependent oxidoreductase (luciferase family)